MSYETLDGVPFSVKAEFVEDDMPMIAAPGYPKVHLRQGDKRVSTAVAAPMAEPGEWAATISVPSLGITEPTQLSLVWVFKTTANSTERLRESVTVLPSVDERISDIVLMPEDVDFRVIIPYARPQDIQEAIARIYTNNELVSSVAFMGRDIIRGSDKFVLELSASSFVPSLSANLVQVQYAAPRGRKTSSYKIWKITPQIAIAMTHISDQLDKARIANTIPELEFADGDILSYLERGLSMFNALGFTTGFTGTNMRGALLDAWLLCSQYYALCAQHIAESQLAFNYGGQGVSLEVDRTPAIESAIGRLESQINERVLALKKQLSRQSIIAGDGSVGNGPLRNKFSQAWVGSTNAPTTRISMGVGSRYVGRRG